MLKYLPESERSFSISHGNDAQKCEVYKVMIDLSSIFVFSSSQMMDS